MLSHQRKPKEKHGQKISPENVLKEIRKLQFHEHQWKEPKIFSREGSRQSITGKEYDKNKSIHINYN